MLKNYLKIAIAVLKRRKFFTFISLFGISFTLTIITVALAFLNKYVNEDYPDYKRERSLYVNRMQLSSSKEPWINISAVSFYFLEKYVTTVKSIDKLAFFTGAMKANSFVRNRKISIDYKYTNADYWNVLEYDFLEGKPYNEQDVKQANPVVVISEETREDYFGNDKQVVGKYVTANNVNYRVIGVVKNVPGTLDNFASDLYLPYTVSKQKWDEVSLLGPFSVVLLAKSEADVPAMQKEFNQMMRKVKPPTKEFDQVFCNADSFLESKARGYAGDGQHSGLNKLAVIIGGFFFLFLLLPTINLININVTRIMERSSEIGVRKAFGASSKTLVYQFIVENLLLTFIGAILGLVFSLLAIRFINAANIISNMELSLNPIVLIYSLVAYIFFGVLSGVYPAWRMSRLNVVSALKAQ
jgi:putative ABC transport system permease protein